jgi:hypothetical protein
MLSMTRGRTPVGARLVALCAVALLAGMALLGTDALAAQAPVGLGTADSFAILSGSTVTNTGPSTIGGDLGVSPGAAVTGFPPGTLNGTLHAADAVAAQAKLDLTTAYDDAAGRNPPAAIPADLTGLTLTAGVYRGGALGLSGAMTLDAQGDSTAVFILQATSTLITASASHVNLVNGAQACNVFWQTAESATLGSASVFAGNILALTSVSVNNGVTVQGRLLARNGAVTLINDTVTAAHCSTAGGGGGGGTGGGGGGTGGGGTTGGGNGSATFTTGTPSVARRVGKFGTSVCVHRTFDAVVTGLKIRRVVFSLGSKVIATVNKAPFEALIGPDTGGIYTIHAHVTFTDGTRARNFSLRFAACARAAVSPSQLPRGPGRFTG